MSAKRTFTIFGIVLAALPALAQTISLRPGKYDATTEIEMPGMKMPPMKNSQCITPDDLKDFSKKLLDPDQTGGCKVSDYKVASTRLTFTAVCTEDKVARTVAADMTFAGDSFNAVMKTKGGKEGELVIKMAAKRAGDCTK